jgi:hypothetical protein
MATAFSPLCVIMEASPSGFQALAALEENDVDGPEVARGLGQPSSEPRRIPHRDA